MVPIEERERILADDVSGIILLRRDGVDRLGLELLEFIGGECRTAHDVRNEIEHHQLVAREKSRRNIGVLELRPGVEIGAQPVHERRDFLRGALPRSLPQEPGGQRGRPLFPRRVGERAAPKQRVESDERHVVLLGQDQDRAVREADLPRRGDLDRGSGNRSAQRHDQRQYEEEAFHRDASSFWGINSPTVRFCSVNVFRASSWISALVTFS